MSPPPPRLANAFHRDRRDPLPAPIATSSPGELLSVALPGQEPRSPTAVETGVAREPAASPSAARAFHQCASSGNPAAWLPGLPVSSGHPAVGSAEKYL